ncbi:MAG: PAS domain S-box protein [Candidatus Magnetomorum sp.]|nr:PAS domain S-box protein [Candidatus Magnetomorum sp.]
MAKILIVDDDLTFVHLLTNLIASFGDTPLTATQGAHVFQILEEESVDLILLDIYMPIVSGLDIIRQMKRHPDFKHIPVIMITGSSKISLMTECFEAGASDFITKPISPVVLQARLSTILGKQNDINRLEKEIQERKNAESSLRKLSIAVEQSPGIVFLTDLHGRIEYANPKCIEITGYHLEEILGHNPQMFQSQDMSGATYKDIWKKVSKGGTWKGELCNRKKNGTLFWVLCSISPILNEQGIVSNFLAVQEDISERIQAEAALAKKTQELKISESRLRTIIEATGDGIIVIGKNKDIHFVNPAAEKLLGKPAKNLLGEKFYYPLVLNKMTEIIIQRPEQPDIVVDYRVVETETDDGKVWVASIREILRNNTDTSISDQDTHCSEQVIDDHQKTITSTEKNRSTPEVRNTNADFLSNISHEFRTPMHAILSFANFGIKKIDQVPGEKLLHYFEQIKASANRLMPLIDDLLELSNLEAGKIPYKLTEQDIFPTLMSVVQEQKNVAEEKHIDIQIAPFGDQINAVFNKSGIIKVMRNILQNAIHFSPEQSHIIVNVENYSEMNTQWQKISISDEGIGIPEKELEDIFIKFIQSSKTKTCSGGTGIGLAICKHIISEHGGHIWAENNPGKGATISFTLPVS